MKKIMQRFLGIAAAAALIVTYAVPVAASSSHTHKEGEKIDDTSFSPQYTITLKEPEGVTIADGAHYGAYQIFSGTVKGTKEEEPGDTNEKIPITDIKWGNAFGDVDALAGGSGSSGKEQWQSNIVKFVYALATASSIDDNPTYAYAFKGFDDFKDFAGDDENTLADEFYFDIYGSKTDYDNVNFDKLAVKVADVLATKNDRQWLQMFADILGGYAKSTEGGYAATGYAVRYYESVEGTEANTYTITVPAGYYMIRDFSTIETGEANSAFSARLLFVANNITQTLKSDVPTLKKNIIRAAVGAALSTNPDKTEWDTEAAGVGDVVTFQLTATLPDNYDNFLGGYTFEFEDTLPVGLTINTIDEFETNNFDQYVKVEAKGLMVTSGSATKWDADKSVPILTNSYVPDTDHEHFKDTSKKAYTGTLDDNKLVVEFPCLKELVMTDSSGNTCRLGYDKTTGETSIIYITYTVTVNSNAVVEPASSTTKEKNGNPNSAVLTYSDNPQAYGDTDFTTAKLATVYTYGTEITKVDAAEFIKENNTTAASALLPGAEFALVREDPITKGSYQIAALGTTPVASGGKEYTPVTAWNTLGEAADDKSIQSITKEYVDKQTTAGAYAVNCTVTSDVNGSIKISGLNDGVKYYLVEVKTPDDNLFATIDPFTLTLTAATENGEYTGLLAEDGVVVNHEIKGENTLSIDNFVQIVNEEPVADTNGIAELIVANFKYVDLPSTGGTGTYIFYIIGGVVVAASLVLFFLSRKKTTK